MNISEDTVVVVVFVAAVVVITVIVAVPLIALLRRISAYVGKRARCETLEDAARDYLSRALPRPGQRVAFPISCLRLS